MKDTSLIVCFIINIIICFGIPIGALTYFIVTKKKVVKSFFIGMGVFLFFQVFTRIPIIQLVLPKMAWYNVMSISNPILYGLFLGITAGIFEEVGRFLGFKIGLKNNRSWIDGIAFGFGHGGIEAMVLTGTSSISNLVILIGMNNGTFDASKLGMSEESLRALFNSTGSMIILLGGIERIFAITIQIALTLLVLYGIRKRKLIYLGMAILMHTIIDSPVIIFPKVFGMGMLGLEVFVGISAIVAMIFIIKSKGLFNKLEEEI
ncbi:YhfC family glutamic-type intramembrane protease [Clostridium sp. C2-6-12]|uniref:YhfC family intramembrane metalloprotease n=1 Tax=Clostridium sp. C2-6-12 TaxID=2698832 RepID=UPI001369EBF1|nr:YhfC family glutamic-type intramembrane protease [Clostridium sp. C2-6-12]